jgi:hypothetical protein
MEILTSALFYFITIKQNFICGDFDNLSLVGDTPDAP